MSIDLEREYPLSLKEARHHPEFVKLNGGKPVCINTIHNWAHRRVVGGVKLETVKVRGILVTTAEACERFATKYMSDVLGGSGTLGGRRKAELVVNLLRKKYMKKRKPPFALAV